MSRAPLGPNSTIGIVGGGQLGRMLTHVAQRMGYRVAVFTGGPKDTPAGLVAETEIAASFDDGQAAARFVDEVDVVTWEFENVETDWLVSHGHDVPIRPSVDLVRTAQDRVLEKHALTALGAPVASWRIAGSPEELVDAVDALGGSVLAKTSRWGYDGRGQARIDRSAGRDADRAVEATWHQLGAQPLVVETIVAFDRELSVVVARGADREIVDHGVMENVHVNQILDTTVAPARVAADVAESARSLARSLADGFDLVGVMCVELFQVGSELLVNEVAPRAHNSGHCTIEGAEVSQFEQQLRAVTGLPLGDGTCRPAAMVQLLGEMWTGGEPDWSAALADPGVHLHLYGKAQHRPGRKMGHITCVADNVADALSRALTARQRADRR